MTDKPIWDESDYQRVVEKPAAERGGRGGLTIVREDVLVAIPRGDEELRVTFTMAKTPEGKDTAWHSIREFYQDRDGTWKPTKKGITIRGRELHAVAAAFAKAVSGGQPPPNNPPPRQLLPHEEYDRRAGRPVR